MPGARLVFSRVGPRLDDVVGGGLGFVSDPLADMRVLLFEHKCQGVLERVGERLVALALQSAPALEDVPSEGRRDSLPVAFLAVRITQPRSLAQSSEILRACRAGDAHLEPNAPRVSLPDAFGRTRCV